MTLIGVSLRQRGFLNFTKFAKVFMLDVEIVLSRLSRLVCFFIHVLHILVRLFVRLHLYIFRCMKPPTSFLQAMEEYVKEAPLAAGAKKEQVLPECFLVFDPPSCC